MLQLSTYSYPQVQMYVFFTDFMIIFYLFLVWEWNCSEYLKLISFRIDFRFIWLCSVEYLKTKGKIYSKWKLQYFDFMWKRTKRWRQWFKYEIFSKRQSSFQLETTFSYQNSFIEISRNRNWINCHVKK